MESMCSMTAYSAAVCELLFASSSKALKFFELMRLLGSIIHVRVCSSNEKYSSGYFVISYQQV